MVSVETPARLARGPFTITSLMVSARTRILSPLMGRVVPGRRIHKRAPRTPLLATGSTSPLRDTRAATEADGCVSLGVRAQAIGISTAGRVAGDCVGQLREGINVNAVDSMPNRQCRVRRLPSHVKQKILRFCCEHAGIVLRSTFHSQYALVWMPQRDCGNRLSTSAHSEFVQQGGG
jgi:hypothetical protein